MTASHAGAVDTAETAGIPWFDHAYDGYLVVAEGVNGAGKTTLLDRLADVLGERGLTVVRGRHPTAEALRLPSFRRYQTEPDARDHIEYRAVLAALLSDRLQHVYEVVRPALARGDCVLMDRYIHTLVAMMRARGYEERWLLQACDVFPRPDVAILLEVPLAAVVDRVGARAGEAESHVEEELFLRIQEEYRRFAHEGSLTPLRSDEASAAALAERACDLLECARREREGRTGARTTSKDQA